MIEFKNGKIYYSILPKINSLFIPKINNPDFLDDNFNYIDIPGIIQLLNGDIGIAEQILKPSIDIAITNEPSLKHSDFIDKDSGLKAIERTIISTMMESHKPFVEVMKIVLQLLAIAEHVACMYMATSVPKTNIGIPCRKPQYWNPTLNYSLNEITNKVNDSNNIYKNIKTQIVTNQDNVISNIIKSDTKRLYIGYFDEDGNDIDPPKWIKNSGFEKIEQLSTNMTKGTNQLESRYNKILETVDDGEIKNIAKDMIYGSNYTGTNDSNDSGILNEWIMNIKTAQLRDRYYLKQESTTQQIKDITGKPKEPYIYIPKYDVNYKGKRFKVEIPLAYPNQVYTEQKYSLNTFYDKIEIGKGTYSNIKQISSINIYENTDKNKPYNNINRTKFSHKYEYIPDNIKNYFIPSEYEEVSVYEYRNVANNKLIKTETEKTLFTMDFETDYDIRLIKVVNEALDIPENYTKEEYYEELEEDFINGKLNIDKYGTVSYKNNTIPQKNKSTKNINKLNEGIIRHGIDPRYLNKKIFWLVEAIKKEQSTSNNESKNNVNILDSDKNDTDYNILHRKIVKLFIIKSLIPIIGKSLIPKINDFIKAVNKQEDMSKLLIDIGVENGLNKYFKAFSKNGEARKKNKKSPKTLDDSEKSTKFTYKGVQDDKEADDFSILDGESLATFGNIKFGMGLNNGELNPINEKNTDKEQPIFKAILDIIKMPFLIMKKVFDWIKDWVKKLINPLTVISAINEFISFKWLIDIFSKNSMLSMMGIKENDTTNIKCEINQELYNQSSYGKYSKRVEVSVYDIYKNDIKIDTEKIEKIMTSKEHVDYPDDMINMEYSSFYKDDTIYSNNEKVIISTMPIQREIGYLKFMEKIFNALINMPVTILGLEPTIYIPKFGTDISLTSLLEKKIINLNTKIII